MNKVWKKCPSKVKKVPHGFEKSVFATPGPRSQILCRGGRGPYGGYSSEVTAPKVTGKLFKNAKIFSKVVSRGFVGKVHEDNWCHILRPLKISALSSDQGPKKRSIVVIDATRDRPPSYRSPIEFLHQLSRRSNFKKSPKIDIRKKCSNIFKNVRTFS